ncbi:zinc finger protein 383-like [Sitodiplosis mosellana]|uniref:zinc finger protein 383-like n=1 Tax=Sitodiplosis mosellana TaxID=263140 RepID=UPI002444C9A3|nr:zinc finger protein 383-like [Sitodiplosis mosellana]
MDSFQKEPLNLTLIQSAESVKSKQDLCKVCNSEYCIVNQFHEYQSELSILNPYHRYECSLCGKSYSWISTFRTHQRTHVENKKVCCGFCSESFDDECHWQKHLLEQHTKVYECSICAKRFSRQNSLSAHCRIHKEREARFKCDFCGKHFRWKSNLKAHLLAYEHQRYACAFCQKHFETMDRLQKHQEMHANSENQCRYCEKAFLKRHKLNNHIRLNHRNVAPWQCTFPNCSESFGTATKYRSHIYEIHDAPKPFACKECDRTFQTTHNLATHEATHEKSTHFECDICGYQFQHKRNLNRHKIQQHGQNKGLNDNDSRTRSSNNSSLIKKLPTPRPSPYIFRRKRYFCKKCHRCFVYRKASLNCRHYDTRYFRNKINNGLNGAANIKTTVDEQRTAGGGRSGGGGDKVVDGMKVKISLVTENRTNQIIPLYELNIPAVDSISTTAIDITNSKTMAFDSEHPTNIEPIILVQTFTTPLDSITLNNSIKQNISVDISNEVDPFETFCKSLAPEIIVIDDSNSSSGEEETFLRNAAESSNKHLACSSESQR